MKLKESKYPWRIVQDVEGDKCRLFDTVKGRQYRALWQLTPARFDPDGSIGEEYRWCLEWLNPNVNEWVKYWHHNDSGANCGYRTRVASETLHTLWSWIN